MLYPKSTLSAAFYLVCLLIKTGEGTCGKPFFKPIIPSTEGNGNRILYGVEARKHSHPWQVFISIRVDDYRKRCGGSLIHWKDENASGLVLTAAHCVIDTTYFTEPTVWEQIAYFFSSLFKGTINGPVANTSDVHVYLGAHNIKTLDPSAIRVGVIAIATGEFNKINQVDDFALLKLEREIAYNEFIQGICLPDGKHDMPPAESPCLVTGWGLKEDEKPSSILQQLEVPIVDGQHVNEPLFDKNRMICSHGKAKGAVPTNGDSGGPLACLKNDTFVIYGVVSFSIVEDCSGRTNMTIFMKLSHYMKWIRETIARLES
uniref:Peptidase S1 domain-containing protein n=1 Tax=Trichuris muris TaxID=70415 RepID=A0A5S6Q1D6_TRIMR